MANALTRFLSQFAPGGRKTWDASGVTISGMEPGVHFFSPDGTRTIYVTGGGNSEAETVSAQTAYAAAAYAYVAMRWRAARMAECPLMVVQEDQDSGEEEWIPKHPLAPILNSPSLDYDMAELLFRTSLAIDADGQALWVKRMDGRSRPAGLSLFRGHEFTVESTQDRLRGLYRVSTTRGQVEFAPEQVIYFHEPDPNDWHRGLSRLDVCLSWLNLGQTSRAAVRDLLCNSGWPSLVIQPDPEWNPDDRQMNEYKQAIQEHQAGKNRGKPLVMLGGGTATKVSQTLKDMIPGDILNRVESVVASVFGVPAIVLQYEVGLQNSPWSQMAEARRMAYEDTAEQMWKQAESVLTRQLLRPMDTDETVFVRFDRSRVEALKTDEAQDTAIAGQWVDLASVNERRAKVGLEPSDDPEADKMPWVLAKERQEQFEARIAALSGTQEDDPEDVDTPVEEVEKRRALRMQAKRDLWAALRAEQIQSAEWEWAVVTARQLDEDRAKIVGLFDREFGTKADDNTEKRRRFFRALKTYLDGEGKTRWEGVTRPVALKDAERSTLTVVADLGIRFDLVRPGIAKFAEKEVGFLIRAVTETTREAVEKAVVAGLESGAAIRDIARNLQELPAFSRDRALLVARTESARVMNGAPTAMLQERQRETGRSFVKTWSTALDDRVRDEHAAMEGEQVPVDAKFSNDLEYPSEPNCRCVVTFGEVLDA